MKRARGNSSGARTAREEFVLASHGRDKDSSGPLICLWGDLAGHCLILVKYPTGDDAMHQHRLGQVLGDPAANKVQRMHRYDRNCISVWKIARNLKLAIRLKLLRPESNSKYLGLKELLHRVRTLSSREELLSQHFPPSWPGRVRQTME